MKPLKKVVIAEQEIELTSEEKITALTAENLKLQRHIAKEYASKVSMENKLRILQEENDRLKHLATPVSSDDLNNLAASLLDKLRK